MTTRSLITIVAALLIGASGFSLLSKMKGPQFIFVRVGHVEQNQLSSMFSCENPKARFLGFSLNFECTHEKPLDAVVNSTVSSGGQSISENFKVSDVNNSGPTNKVVDFGMSAETSELLSTGAAIKIDLSIKGELPCKCVLWARFVDDRLIKSARPGRLFRTNQQASL